MTRSRRPHLFTPHSDLPASFASDAPPTGRHRAWNFPYNGWILLSDSDQSEQSSVGDPLENDFCDYVNKYD